ncbi:hypothetical protein VST7929_01310 [Vibrio stylophorae]|uniref:Lipoprotein n=1 Tax=Vibrio stylophorae TaxID=659351 RepID=A0ABN8DVR7_9VIBR|nr:hypothetical protein [Vibrio stylophorae]CAH0533442.1 hypothetical protein VST7929_01310 [Vibrio stylophorae]
MRYLSLLISLLLLVACGGGGGGGSSSSTNPPAAAIEEEDDSVELSALDAPLGVELVQLTPSESSAEPAPANKDFSQLSAPEGFDFSRNYISELRVVANIRSGRINLYRDYQLDESGLPLPNPDTKFLSVQFDGDWQGSWLVFSHMEGVLVEVLDDLNPLQVKRRVFSLPAAQLYWQLNE